MAKKWAIWRIPPKRVILGGTPKKGGVKFYVHLLHFSSIFLTHPVFPKKWKNRKKPLFFGQKRVRLLDERDSLFTKWSNLERRFGPSKGWAKKDQKSLFFQKSQNPKKRVFRTPFLTPFLRVRTPPASTHILRGSFGRISDSYIRVGAHTPKKGQKRGPKMTPKWSIFGSFLGSFLTPFWRYRPVPQY